MMMCNLFSIFDPSNSVLSVSLLSFFLFLFIPCSYFFCSYFFSFLMKIFLFLKTEVDYNLSFVASGVYSFLLSIFFLVFILNFFALFPHLFSLTSHLSMTLPLSFFLWFSIVFFNLVSFTKYFMSHLIPVGTPTPLMSFMVLVELLSNLIRPLALTFRLTANMLAGHLIMALISTFFVNNSLLTLFYFGYLFQFSLIFMEMGVSLIQAYVFFTLITLYAAESGK